MHLPRTQLWMYPSNTLEEDIDRFPPCLEDGLANLKPDQFTPLFVGPPSGKDDSWKTMHPNKSTLEIITSVPWSWFEPFAPKSKNQEEVGGAFDLGGVSGKRSPEYKHAKEVIAQAMWTRARQGLIDNGALTDKLPRNLTNVAVYELATPLTYGHYLWNDKGLYGTAIM